MKTMNTIINRKLSNLISENGDNRVNLLDLVVQARKNYEKEQLELVNNLYREVFHHDLSAEYDYLEKIK